MNNVIIGIHGLSNKPSQELLTEWWCKAILEGLKKNIGMDLDTINFSLVYWAREMYENPDQNPDAYKEAGQNTLKRYNDSWLDYLRAKVLGFGGNMIDAMKKIFGMDGIADLVLARKLSDLNTYYTNSLKRNNLRNMLKEEILSQSQNGRRIMVVAHSMGTIVAYDVLHAIQGVSIEHFVTIGSPLGLPHVKYKIIEEKTPVCTPAIVKKWTNFADRRDPVAIDVYLKDDYQANHFGVRVVDDLVMNDWEGIHHKSYGYLRTPEFTDVVKDFLQLSVSG